MLSSDNLTTTNLFSISDNTAKEFLLSHLTMYCNYGAWRRNRHVFVLVTMVSDILSVIIRRRSSVFIIAQCVAAIAVLCDEHA